MLTANLLNDSALGSLNSASFIIDILHILVCNSGSCK